MIDSILKRDLVPDWLLRIAIRRLLRARLAEEKAASASAQRERLHEFIRTLTSGPIAVETAAANEQHYEVPTEFFRLVLGPHMKYSSAYYPEGVTALVDAERAMLDLTCHRADVKDGQSILELGCGWGSLTLHMAARYPKARIMGVSNSRTQKKYIDAEARRRGLNNVTIVTADMNRFATTKRFDRVVSVEMFEHMRNYEQLCARISGWLKKDGKLFVHIFTHKEFAYPFEVRDETDWMARYFFTGGIMPSDDLLLYFNRNLAIECHWRLNGSHYQRTSRAWLENMDRNREAILPILAGTYGAANVTQWWVYWRVFFMACEELFGYRGGEEWMVSHYRFVNRSAR